MNHAREGQVITATGLHKRYGKHIAVDGVDFTVARGKCFGFLGPNGAGKTTIMKMILGLTPMTSGTLKVFGLPVQQCSREIRRRSGVVPQGDNLDPDFSIIENLRVYATFFGIPKQITEERIPRLLKFAALTDRADEKTESLSGGMKRRLTIARALINDPELVVLDEPTTGLDPQARHVIWSRLLELREQGKTLLLTTHYMEEAERLCDELMILDHGKILAQGSPQELTARHVEPEVIEIRGAASVSDALVKPLDDCRVERMGNSLYCYTQDAAPLLDKLQQVPELTFLHRPSGLEDVFLKLTGRELRE